jgi:hypothetical protein
VNLKNQIAGAVSNNGYTGKYPDNQSHRPAGKPGKIFGKPGKKQNPESKRDNQYQRLPHKGKPDLREGKKNIQVQPHQGVP